MAQRRDRLAPLTGVGFFVSLWAWGFLASGRAPDDLSSVAVASAYAKNGAMATATWMALGLAAIFFLFFVGSLWRVLRSAEGEDRWLSTVALAGGCVAAAGMLLVAGFTEVLSELAAAPAETRFDPSGLPALHALVTDLSIPVTAGMATLLFASALVIVRTGALPRWLGWAAIVLAVASPTPVGFAAFLASSVWVVVVSVLLLRGRTTARSVERGVGAVS